MIIIYSDLLEAEKFYEQAIDQINYALDLIKRVFNGLHPDSKALEERINRLKPLSFELHQYSASIENKKGRVIRSYMQE